MWNEYNCTVVWAFFGIAIFAIGMKTDLFQSCGPCWVFQICWYIKCSTLTTSSFRSWNSSAEIPSPQLALAVAPHSSTLAWKIPWTEEPGGLQSMGSLRVRHDWVTSLSLFTFMHWGRKWQPTKVFVPGESGMEEPGGLPSVGLHRVRHDWSDLAATAATSFVCSDAS